MDSEHKSIVAVVALIASTIMMIVVGITFYNTKRLTVTQSCFEAKYSNCPNF